MVRYTGDVKYIHEARRSQLFTAGAPWSAVRGDVELAQRQRWRLAWNYTQAERYAPVLNMWIAAPRIDANDGDSRGLMAQIVRK